MRKDQNHFVSNFDEYMPPRLHKAVFETATCQRYLFEQRRACALAERLRRQGAGLADGQILEEYERLTYLAVELERTINLCKQQVAI